MMKKKKVEKKLLTLRSINKGMTREYNKKMLENTVKKIRSEERRVGKECR